MRSKPITEELTMELPSYSNTPFRAQLTFHKLIENIEKLATDTTHKDSAYAQSLLQEVAQHPELRDGITDISQIKQNADLIRRLCADFFPKGLTNNEIKAISLPYRNIVFNHSERFKNILKNAGADFEINIRDFDSHFVYVISCCLILNQFYGTQLDFSRPLFYDIPTANGITKHYRILYNADYLEILPTERSVKLSPEDIDLLLDNFDNLELWMEKFPPESWSLRGFSIMTLFDATVENAVSILKEKLLGLNVTDFQTSIESVFRSIYNMPDIKLGFTLYNHEEDELAIAPFGKPMPSFILPGHKSDTSKTILCKKSHHTLIEKKEYFAISNTAEFYAKNPDSHLAQRFLSQGIQSFILAPIVKNGVLLGIMELISPTPKKLNSINANKLSVVMPFITDTLERLAIELQNQIQAVIQNEYTTIHTSVYWKFRLEAQKMIYHRQMGKDYTLKEIEFPDVYPLYGQIDIKGSSEARNQSVQHDLTIQVTELISVLASLEQDGHSNFMDEKPQLNYFLDQLATPLKADTEQNISQYISTRIHPSLKKISSHNGVDTISQYFRETDKSTGKFHTHRRKYETAIAMLNEKLAHIIDSRQVQAQTIFPHYYERFKTDGIEHNLYVSPSITPHREFNLQKLHALRLWQLEVLCEMELAHYRLAPALPCPLEVTTLILVYNATIGIRFRMDEKRFDIDGGYNARFEVAKKRMDKAHVKDTGKRITETGKITIVYSNDSDAHEYKQYIAVLQARNILAPTIETFEIEDLQGISGLKALIVEIVHP